MKVDLKSFEVLEEKIQRTVDLVSRLKDENARLKSEMSDLKLNALASAEATSQLETMKVTHDDLERRLRELQSERETVIARVDGLLANLNKISLD